MSRGAGVMDVIKLGPQAASVKARVSPQQWRRITMLARRRGVTPAGALSGNPLPLQERTNSSLLTQARRMVSQAYDPALKQLDAQQAQLSALSDKRKADNAAYQQWLMGKQAEYNAQAMASQQQYQTYLDNLKATTQASHDQAQAGAQAAVQGQPATISNMGQSNAIHSLSNDTARAVGKVEDARQQTAAMIPSLQMRQESDRLSVIGQGQADEAKRVNDLNAGLQQLGDQRYKVLAAKASDILKNYSNLLGQQVDIANSNRNYQTAANQLGLKQQQFSLDQTKANRSYGLAKQTLAERKATDAAKIKIGYDRIKAQAGQKEADRRLKLQLAKMKNTGPGGVRPPTAAQESKIIQGVSTVAGLYRDLHASHPNGKLPNGQNFRQHLRAQGFSDLQIDVAQDLYAHGGKLSAFGRKQAKLLGITNPYSALGKASVGSPYNGPN